MKIEAMEGNGQVTGVKLASGEVIPAQLVIVSCGVRANVALAHAAGLTVDRAIVVEMCIRDRARLSPSSGSYMVRITLAYRARIPAKITSRRILRRASRRKDVYKRQDRLSAVDCRRELTFDWGMDLRLWLLMRRM